MIFELHECTLMNLQKMMVMNRHQWLFCTVLIVFSATAAGQATSPADEQLTRTNRQEAGHAVVKHLRDGHLEQALKAARKRCRCGDADLACRRGWPVASLRPDCTGHFHN